MLTRHEQAAAFTATTHGRLTGRAGETAFGRGGVQLVAGPIDYSENMRILVIAVLLLGVLAALTNPDNQCRGGDLN